MAFYFVRSSFLSLNGSFFLQTYAAKSPGSVQRQQNGKGGRDIIGRTPVRYLLARIMKVCKIGLVVPEYSAPCILTCVVFWA